MHACILMHVHRNTYTVCMSIGFRGQPRVSWANAIPLIFMAGLFLACHSLIGMVSCPASDSNPSIFTWPAMDWQVPALPGFLHECRDLLKSSCMRHGRFIYGALSAARVLWGPPKSFQPSGLPFMLPKQPSQSCVQAAFPWYEDLLEHEWRGRVSILHGENLISWPLCNFV